MKSLSFWIIQFPNEIRGGQVARPFNFPIGFAINQIYAQQLNGQLHESYVFRDWNRHCPVSW
jgi:hypothetical protein